MTVTIYGYSDDLIEIEGDIEDEYGCGDEGVYLSFGDGTVLRIRYSYHKSAFWSIERVKAGTTTFEHKPGTDIDTDYSDRVTLTGDLGKHKFTKTLPRKAVA